MKPDITSAELPLRRRRWSPAAAALTLLFALTAPAGAQGTAAQAPATSPPAKTASKKDDSIPFFRDGAVPRLKIQIPDAELNQLRQKNREYVRCTVTEDDKTQYPNVGIHLKGAAGSFRGLDDKPALTLNFDKFTKGREFHDLEKIHLNNSVQDPTYLNELLTSELFLTAGIPAARTTHARVWLNGRDLGLYVLKEGFNKDFLKRYFANTTGNFYEPGLIQDLDGQVKLQSGSGPADRSDVKA
ncbi:MAG TPA: CotH kinase family protein, partial [Armatimonadota bacterium]|nr:CotH kinase family protein [Armatimonadota bacterium]